MKFFWQKDKHKEEEKLKATENETVEKEELTPDEFYMKKFKKHDSYASRKKKIALATGFLEVIGESFDEYKLKYDREENDEEIQLRGKLDNFPFRITIDASRFCVNVFCKVTSQIGQACSIYLEYDKKKIPKQKDKDDPFSEEDEIRVFVDKGLFFESDDQEWIDLAMTFWEGISDDLRSKFKEVLVGNKYGAIYIGDGIECEVWDLDDLIKRKAPVTMIVDLCKLMTDTAKEIGSLPVAATPDLGQLVDCEYCGSKYPLGQTAKCPNCGSSYKST